MDEKPTPPRRPRHVSPLLRTLLLLLRLLILLASLFLLGLFIFRYLRRSKSSSTLAILILSAISSGWSLLALVSTCVGHSKLASVMALVDLVHVGAMVAVAVLLRRFATGCGSATRTRRDCTLLRAAFGVAVGLAALYALSTLLSILLLSAFRRARPYGPSPDNDYTPAPTPAPPSTRRRGYITPTLPAGAGEPGFRQSNYTTNSGVTEPQPQPHTHTNMGGSMRGRDSAEAGLLAPPVAHHGAGHRGYAGQQHQGQQHQHQGHQYEPYRVPTPTGTGTGAGAGARQFEMPGERDYGGRGATAF